MYNPSTFSKVTATDTVAAIGSVEEWGVRAWEWEASPWTKDVKVPLCSSNGHNDNGSNKITLDQITDWWLCTSASARTHTPSQTVKNVNQNKASRATMFTRCYIPFRFFFPTLLQKAEARQADCSSAYRSQPPDTHTQRRSRRGDCKQGVRVINYTNRSEGHRIQNWRWK